MLVHHFISLYQTAFSPSVKTRIFLERRVHTRHKLVRLFAVTGKELNTQAMAVSYQKGSNSSGERMWIAFLQIIFLLASKGKVISLNVF